MDFTIDPDGQISLGDAQQQQVADLVQFCKGWHKFFPFIGACFADYFHDDSEQDNQLLALQQHIGDELRNDQIQATVTQSGGKFSITIIS